MALPSDMIRRTRLILIFLLLILTPLVLLGWVGGLRIREQRQQAKEQVEIQRESRLQGIARILDTEVDRLSAELRDQSSDAAAPAEYFTKTPDRSYSKIRSQQARSQAEGPDASTLRLRLLELPLVRDALVFSPKERLLSPVKSIVPSPSADRLLPILQGTLAKGKETGTNPVSEQGSWRTYFWQGGLQWLWIRRLQDGRIICLDLSRGSLMSRFIAALPDQQPLENRALGIRGAPGSSSFAQEPLPRRVPERFQLRDASDKIIHQWGPLAGEELKTDARIRLTGPLSSWTLGYSAPDMLHHQWTDYFGLAAGLGAVGLVIVLLAGMFYRENNRTLKEAGQRVSFVNQVSHELKTPLTNIRLYSELARYSLGTNPEQAATQLEVIENESSRLGRLINNVLSFAKQERHGLQVNPRSCVPDDVVREALAHAAPALERAGITLETEFHAPAPQKLDPDLLEQILHNLVGNAEKYAAAGEFLRIETKQDPHTFTCRVIDRGPGIPRKHRKSVFRPFTRLSDAVNEGSSGTGIGLGLSRDLARLHEGELRLLDSSGGCLFEFTLTSSSS